MFLIIKEWKETKLDFVLIYCGYAVIIYNTFNVKLSNSKLNKLKSGIKTGTEVTVNFWSNVPGNPNHKINFSTHVVTN